MNDYDIFITKSADKELHLLDPILIKRIVTKIESLSRNPRPEGCCKLENKENEYRIRVGDYRIIYIIADSKKQIEIIGISHRRESYR